MSAGVAGPERRAIDPARSHLAVRTRARGMLAALAHDLELRTSELEGHATLDGETWSAELGVPVASLRVAGTLRGDRLDTAALSGADRAEIERKIREEVLPRRAVLVRARGASRQRGDATVEASRSATTGVRLRAEERADGSLAVTGTAELSLRALGVAEVKAPLGAFKVADAVEVYFEITLRPPEA